MTSSQEICFMCLVSLCILHCTLDLEKPSCCKSEKETDTQDGRAERWEEPGSLKYLLPSPEPIYTLDILLYEIMLLHQITRDWKHHNGYIF